MKEGWEYKKLGEVCDIVGGGTPDKKNKNFYGGNIPWATVRDMNVESVKHTEYSITKEGLDKSSSHIIHEGEVIIATRVGLGKVCLLEQDTAINQDLKGIVPKKNDINRKYLFYWFKFEAKNIISNGVGATVKGVKLSFINNLSFPCISLSEQHRIVSYLDAAFAKIDAVAKNAEDALNEAKALFQSALAKMMEPKEGWEEKTLEDICESVNYGTSKPSIENGEYKYLRMNNITNDGFLDLSHYKTISLSGKELDKSIVKRGDILFNRTNSRELVGKSCVFTEDEPMVIAGYLIRIRLKAGLEPQFITYNMNLQRSLGYFNHLIVGAVHQANISAKNIQKVHIVCPPLSTQQSIVATLDNLKSKVDQLQSNISRTLTECAALKQSILRKTFE